MSTYGFPRDDRVWADVADFLHRHVRSDDLVLAPNNFLYEIRNTVHYFAAGHIPLSKFRLAVIHKRRLAQINPFVLQTVLSSWNPVFVNEMFVVFSRSAEREMPVAAPEHIQSLMESATRMLPPTPPMGPGTVEVGVVVTTYNRSWALARSLPAIMQQKAHVLVVDDHSCEDEAAQNEEICRRLGALYIKLSGNRGVACVVNVGLGYFLADSRIEWIAVIQDDVELVPDAMAVLSEIADNRTRPILTGYYAQEHPVRERQIIGGREVLLQWTCSGQFLYADRDYWLNVLPIPTQYLGAPKPKDLRPSNAGGSDWDWWATAWAPNSALKRGLDIICVPDLATHLAHSGELSTWGNKHELRVHKVEFSKAQRRQSHMANLAVRRSPVLATTLMTIRGTVNGTPLLLFVLVPH